MTRDEARAILRRANALWRDFHALPSADVETLIAEADRLHYRAPKNANGSRARMFCQFLQRRAGTTALADLD
jgi:hypothetical protein